MYHWHVLPEGRDHQRTSPQHGMETEMAAHEIRIDLSRTLADEPGTGHNRWHPDIPPILTIEPGDEVLMEARDGGDALISRNSTLDDLLSLDLNLVHPLTGPVYIKNAEPGDLLVVDVLDVIPGDYGFTSPFRASATYATSSTSPSAPSGSRPPAAPSATRYRASRSRRTVHGGDGRGTLARHARAHRCTGERPHRRRRAGAAALCRGRDHVQPHDRRRSAAHHAAPRARR